MKAEGAGKTGKPLGISTTPVSPKGPGLHLPVIAPPETKERRLEEVVKAAEQAAVLVLVY